MNENLIKERSLSLSKKNKIKFNLSSLIRIRELYQLFEEEVENDHYDYAQRFKNSRTQFSEFSDYILNSIFKNDDLNFAEIDKFKALEDLAPQDDEYSSYQAAIAVNIVLIATNIIKIIKGEENKVTSTIDYTLDVINNWKSEEFFTNNPEGSDEESEEYLDHFYDKELQIENKLLDRIDELSQLDFINFNEENKIN